MAPKQVPTEPGFIFTCVTVAVIILDFCDQHLAKT